MRWYLLLLLLVLTGCGVSEPMEDASIPPVQAVPESELAPMPEPEAADFVRVQEYLPDILVDLKYAGAENFTGQAVYDFTDAYLRYGTVQKLSSALDILMDQGYTLLIWDAFRPTQAQFRTRCMLQTRRQVLPPTAGETQWT